MLGKKMEIWWASEISFSCPLSTTCMSESVSLVIACSRRSDSGVQHKIREQEKNKKEKRERVSSVNRCQSSNGCTPHCLLHYFEKYVHVFRKKSFIFVFCKQIKISFSFKDERTEHSTFFVGDFQSDYLTWHIILLCPQGRCLVVLC